MDTTSAGIALFLVMDPIGNIPFFLSVLRSVPEARRRTVVMRELVIAYAVLVGFLYVGAHVVRVLGLEQESIRIAGGIILFLIAIRMVFPDRRASEPALPDGEPFVVPLAIPCVAGPSALAMVLLLAQSHPDRTTAWLFALTVAWIASALVLLASPVFLRLLGERGIQAMERLMGMILVAVSVQMFLDGIAQANLAG